MRNTNTTDCFIEKETDNNTEKGEKSVVKKFETWVVCKFSFLPKWLQDNEYLVHGHRPHLPSFRACIMSIFRAHTETGNIWTHLCGCLLFIILAVILLGFSTPHFSWVDTLVIGVFFAGAIFCLGFSAAYHTFCCHSPKWSSIFSKLDYLGIVFLITGSKIPWIYYGFYCSFWIKFSYFSILSALCVMTIICALWDKFALPQFRPVRAAVFIAFGLSGAFPGIHLMVTIDWHQDHYLRYCLECAILMGFLYILGALLYACRVPERFFPGRCDYLFQSHQIFHIFVIIAAIVHLLGIWRIANHRLDLTHTCPSPPLVNNPIVNTLNLTTFVI